MNPRNAGFGGSLDVPAILEFIDSGRNVLLAANSQVSDTMRTLAAEVGIDVDEKGTKVFDHFSFSSLGGKADHTLIAASSFVDAPAILGKGVKVSRDAVERPGTGLGG